MFTGQIGPDVEVENFYSIIAGQWARADANGSTDDSPYFYSLFYPEPGRMVTGYRRAVANASLATVRADFALAQPDTYGYKRVRSGFVDSGVNDFDTGNFGPFLRVSLPFTRTEYYNTDPGVGSSGDFEEWSEEAPVSVVYAASPPEYVAGRTYHERWNRGVFSPPLPPTDFLWRGVTRTGDTLQIELPAYGDGDGRGGASVTTSAGTALFRNGTKLADRAGSIPVPAGEATYRLETRTARGAPFVLSTRVETVRTFRSGHVDSGTLTVPLWSVRFSPNLNERNMAPANRVFPVPVAVAAQPGSDAGTVVNRTVEVSFDDGVTWRRVRLKGSVALVPHPAGSGFVSLRAGVTDSEGNTVKQTVIRAYRY
jgi:hypothetical protein